jgi:hypothetical protein
VDLQLRRLGVVLALAGLVLCGPGAPDALAGAVWKELSRTPAPEPVLALAFVGAGRLLVLSPLSVSLWQLDAAPRREARIAWPEAASPVRHAGGAIIARAGDPAAWLLTSHAARPRLLRIEGARLVLDVEAEAAPWPDAPLGLRFRAGTNLLEGLEAGVTRPALVALDPVSRAAVAEDGTLLVNAAPAGVRVGAAIATLWPGTLLASAAEPPGAEDALILLSRERGRWRLAPALRVAGVVRALAVNPEGAAAARVVVAIATPGGHELVCFEARARP